MLHSFIIHPCPNNLNMIQIHNSSTNNLEVAMRKFDQHLDSRLWRMYKISGERMTANWLTFMRIPTTMLFAVAHLAFAPLYPILCWLDAFCDIADGPFSRLIRGTRYGWFWDQAFDKFSNNGRTWIMYLLLPVGALVVDFKIAEYSAFWLLMLMMTNIDGFLLVWRIMHVIYPETRPVLEPNEQTSVHWGKIKVWPQQFGIVLLAAAYTHMTGWPAWIMIPTSFTSATLLAELIPADVRFRRQYQAGIFLLFALSFPNPITNMIPFNAAILLGQLGLAGSVPLGIMSLYGQFKRQLAHNRKRRASHRAHTTPQSAPAEP